MQLWRVLVPCHKDGNYRSDVDHGEEAVNKTSECGCKRWSEDRGHLVMNCNLRSANRKFSV
jgi:hypothetical protein